MNDTKQEIIAKLAQYFQIKHQNTQEIIDPIYQSLMNNVNLDMQKFNSCLEMLIALRDNGYNLVFQNQNNMFDVSSKSGQVQVKAVVSNNKPVLFFYDRNGEIFYKLKYATKNNQKALIAETSINEYDVTTDKLPELEVDKFFYSHNDRVIFDDEDVLFRSRTLAKTGYAEEVFEESDMCDEYRNFYLFLKSAIGSDGKKSLEHLSVVKADFLFASFYQNLKELCRIEDEFSISELVYIMDAVLNGGKSGLASPTVADSTVTKSKFTDTVIRIADICANSVDKKVGSFEIGGGTKKRIINFCTSEKYASLHILDSNNTEIVTYLIGQTDKGFTLFKAIRDEQVLGKDAVSRMFTLNLTDSTLRINASAQLDSRKSGNGLESDMDFLKDGEITLVNTESKILSKAKEFEQNLKTNS